MKNQITRPIFFIGMFLTCLLFASFTANAVGGAGATVPFKTYEAEDGTWGGGASLNNDATIKIVSSERGYVHLNATNEYVEFTATSSANRLTLRYSIPQNSSGTISLYKNGIHNQNISLTSAQCYDADNPSYPRRYNEVSVAISITTGNVIRLRKDSGDACSWYAIDLIETENAPSARTIPANYLSITDFGATPDDATDDTQAIIDCIAAVVSQGKSGVWIPTGTFNQSSRINLPTNKSLKGAGMWYSVIHNTVAGTSFSDDIGYSLNSGSTISYIKFTGVGVSRQRAAILFRPTGHHNTMNNLWIQNVACVYGWDNGSPEVNNVTFKNSRVIGTYFDGIHWGDGNAFNNLVENSFFRGLGDDAVAQVNQVSKPLCYGNVAHFNTIIANYKGRGMSNVGGDDLTYTDNYISCIYNAGIIITTEQLSSACRPIQGFQCLRNTIHNCSRTGFNHGGIHISLSVNPMEDVVIKDCLIEQGETTGVRINDTNYGDSGGRTIFENNDACGNAGGGYINSSNDIVPTLINNQCFTSLKSAADLEDMPEVSTPLDKSLNSLKVYPVPASGQLNLQSNAKFNAVFIYNSLGAKVYEQHFDEGRTSLNFDISNLCTGVYSLEVRDKQEKYVKRIVIQD